MCVRVVVAYFSQHLQRDGDSRRAKMRKRRTKSTVSYLYSSILFWHSIFECWIAADFLNAIEGLRFRRVRKEIIKTLTDTYEITYGCVIGLVNPDSFATGLWYRFPLRKIYYIFDREYHIANSCDEHKCKWLEFGRKLNQISPTKHFRVRNSQIALLVK